VGIFFCFQDFAFSIGPYAAESKCGSFVLKVGFVLFFEKNLELFQRDVMWSETRPITLLMYMSQLDPSNPIGQADGRVTGTDRECAIAIADRLS
jgi:hypothetical protein